MARISGVTLPKNKRIEIGLTYIKGIGLTTSKDILEATGINPDTRVHELQEADEQKIRDEIVKRKLEIEGDLVRKVLANIKLKKDINSYQGDRHKKHLPVRGQGTKNNNRTVRGNKRQTAGSGRAKAAQKT